MLEGGSQRTRAMPDLATLASVAHQEKSVAVDENNNNVRTKAVDCVDDKPIAGSEDDLLHTAAASLNLLSQMARRQQVPQTSTTPPVSPPSEETEQ
ncbi:MAG: hypothetical protein MHM6MM_000832 [Cercozoa sp. M6MM]